MAMALGNQSIFKEKKSINLYVYNTHRWCHNKKVDIFLIFWNKSVYCFIQIKNGVFGVFILVVYYEINLAWKCKLINYQMLNILRFVRSKSSPKQNFA